MPTATDFREYASTSARKLDDADASEGRRGTRTSLRQITQELLVALVESETNSGLIFVAVARNAYQAGNSFEGSAALSKAEVICRQATELADRSCGDSHKEITDRLRELQAAIEGLADGSFEREKGAPHFERMHTAVFQSAGSAA